MEIGAQFYTLRDYCKDLDGFKESLKRVADIGYKNVQISGTCEYSAEWLRDALKETGLKCVLTHTPADKIVADPKRYAMSIRCSDAEMSDSDIITLNIIR